MNINITGKNMDLTEPIKNYVEEKINALEKFINIDSSNLKAEVVVGKASKHHNKGEFYEAETNLFIPQKSFVAKSNKDDLYASINEMQDILKREVVKYKEIQIDKSQNTGSKE